MKIITYFASAGERTNSAEAFLLKLSLLLELLRGVVEAFGVEDEGDLSSSPSGDCPRTADVFFDSVRKSMN